ncbi:type II toxin-antitoxin system death-on-curing family toxin [Microbacterium suaedae]|uniref:type II toxin-antitoxin system death-on-curing family toxin n=1 Tax=Microbacterium suaedae TaxID=2067813 RepID=UPI000DA19469|nr:type II toxin-antitoxin system death-on-curing family toxin [Microbacterium suaedae]
MIEHLTDEDAFAVVEWLGFHVRDAGLLSSAIARPRAGFAGEDVYPTLHAKAAALLESLARNPPLYDGNKRTAWMLTLAFLSRNGVRHTMTADEAFEYVIGVASGEVGLEQSTSWLESHLEPLRP